MSPKDRKGSSGPEATELAAECGLVLDEWQAADLDDAMSERADGSWAASEVDEICSRQNGKNIILEARELAGVILLGESIIHTAHLFPTARESFMRLLALVEGHADVKRMLSGQWSSPASGYEMRFTTGGRIRFIARSRTSGRGLTGDVLVFDEFQDLVDEAQGALLPTISARPNAQAWYLGSAPDIGSTVAHRVRARGRSRVPGRFSYKEHSAEPDSDLDDRAAWCQANPAFPHRISEETIESERLSMSDEMFARERLSISPDPLESGGPFGPAWAKICDPTITADAKVFALDVNPDRSWAGIVGVGGGVVSVVEYRPGLNWIVDQAKYLREKYRVPLVLDKTGPAGALVDDLRRARVRLIELDGTQMCQAAETFYDAVIDGTVKVRSNDDLDRAVAGAAKQPVGDAWKWGRKSSASEISLLVASSIGVWAAKRASKSRIVNLAEVMARTEDAPADDH